MARPLLALLTLATAQGSTTQQSTIAEIRQLIERARYGEAEQQARALLAATEAKSGADSVETARVIDVLVESLVQGGKARSPETRTLAERALKVQEAALGPDHPDVAVTLAAMGAMQMSAGDYPASLPLLRRALEIRERALGPNDPLTAASLTALGGVTTEQGDLAGGRALLERALQSAEAAHGPNHALVGRALFNGGRNAMRRGDLAASQKMLARALGIFEAAYGPEHQLVGTTLGSLATVEQRLGSFDAARSHYERAVQVVEKTSGPESHAFATTINDFGLLEWTLGDYDRARANYNRALAIWTALNSQMASAALNNLGILERRAGSYPEARAYYERSLAIKEKFYGPTHAETALVLHNLGNLFGDIGDDTSARRCFERAIDIRVQQLGPTHSLVASSRFGLAQILNSMGLRPAARRAFDDALAVWEKNGVATEIATGLSGLAEFIESDDPAGAIAMYERALAIYSRAYGDDHPDLAYPMGKVAEIHARRGAADQALELYQRARTILERSIGTANRTAADLWFREAELRAKRGDAERAVDASLRAEAIAREGFVLAARALSERQALDYASLRRSALDPALSILARNQTGSSHEGQVFDAVIKSRALVLDEMARRHRPLAGDPALAPLVETLAAARQRLANLTVRGPQGSVTAYRTLLDRARGERDAAEEALALRSLDYRTDRAASAAGLSEVSRALPAGAALISFVHYHDSGAARSSDAYLAIVLRAGSDRPVVVPLGSASRMDARIDAWRAAAAAASGAPVAEASYRRIAASLRAIVWDPLASAIGGAQQVLVVPDGALNLVNFAALPAPGGGYLVEKGPRIHYISAERDITLMDSAQAGTGMLIVGDPAFDSVVPARTSASGSSPTGKPAVADQPVAAASGRATTRGGAAECAAFERVRFERLPATRAEADHVARLWRAGRQEPLERLTAQAAAEAAFKRAAAGRRILHLATHAFFLTGRCAAPANDRRGVGGLTQTQKPQKPSPTRQGTPADALLLSGLALAGANNRRNAGLDADDGILTAEEIGALDLHGVELAVLSACDTGIGEVRSGEGVFGLRRAFRIAGARTIVMSLWSVEDASAAAWMSVFYSNRLEKQLPVGDAVHQASLQLLRDRRAKRASTHPFYWAGFIAAGSVR